MTVENSPELVEALSEYIRDVSSQAFEFIKKHAGSEPPLGSKPIVLKPHTSPIVFWPLKPDMYEIGFTVRGYYPHQIIYQVAQEICHIYSDPRANGVFIEILCQKTAIDVLEEIGAAFVANGKGEVEKYISNIMSSAESEKKMKLSDIKSDQIINIICEREEEYFKTGDQAILYDRTYNDLLAFKLKEILDQFGKLTLIKHISRNIIPPPPNSPADLTTNIRTKVDFKSLLTSLESENKELAKLLSSMIIYH